MGFVALFRFVHCVFHSFLSPFQSTIPPHFFTHSHSPTTTYHYTTSSHTENMPHNHACVLLCFLFACDCACISLSACWFQAQSNNSMPSPHLSLWILCGLHAVSWFTDKSTHLLMKEQGVALLCVHLTSHKPLTSCDKAEEDSVYEENCYGHTKRKAPLLV